jgi:hypothetical protein
MKHYGLLLLCGLVTGPFAVRALGSAAQSRVRDYLVQEGMSMNAVSAVGFGKLSPVASNDTSTGRQQNRRVELVVSGELIGQEIGSIR